ncbi:HesA/MoeB/ThiF family protein [Geodermatophilus sp. SYSU D00815]
MDGGLCLLFSDDDWRPGTTLAALLAAQLPRLLAAGRAAGADPATLALEAGAEPVWTRLRRPELGGLLVDSACLPAPEVPGGVADVVFLGNTAAPVHALVTVLDADHRVLWATGVLGLQAAERVPWVRLPGLPAGPLEAGDLWRRAAARVAEALPADTGARPKPVLVLVGSEGAGRRPCEEFLLLTRTASGVERSMHGAGGAQPRPAGPGSADATVSAQQLTLFDLESASPAGASDDGGRVRVRRSWPFSRADLAARLPGDRGERLAAASVTVVGVGALGGPIALELARAGVGHLHLIDGDVHDPATSARQLLGIRHAGDLKVLGIAGRILSSNPHTHVTIAPCYMGADGGTELPRLRAEDLVIDATATQSVPRYLAAHLRLTSTPMLVASATAGGWGGTIVTLPAAGGGCWECLQLHRAARAVPWPPARPDGELVPAGCSHPTYIGGYPDLGHVALQAARTALALLTRDSSTGAASPFGDLQVVTLHDRRGPAHPRWRPRPLSVHPDCPLHEPSASQVTTRGRGGRPGGDSGA